MSEVAGFKTLDEGHVDVWPTVQRLDQTVVHYEYDYFPRGRVNWRKEDDKWLLVLDPKLNRSPFITYIVLAWKIPRTRLIVLTTRIIVAWLALGLRSSNNSNAGLHPSRHEADWRHLR